MQSKNQLMIVEVKPIEVPITKSPGFAKKGLSDFKLDACALCGFGCTYCSSNNGNYLRINRKKFADDTEKQLGVRILPADDPNLMYIWRDVLERLQKQVEAKKPDWGQDKTWWFPISNAIETRK